MRNTLILALLFPAVSFAATLDVAGIDSALGAKGKWNDAEKAYRIEFARDGRISWATFQTGKEKPAIMLGEFVLAAGEVNPAIDAAVAGGLEVMALHSTSLSDEPRVFSLHVSGEGEAKALAAGVRKIRDSVAAASGKPRLATSAETDGSVQTMVVPREAVMPCGCRISSAMGVATTATFRGSSVKGAVPCAYGEAPGVLKALRAGGMEITAIVNHIDAEAPRLLFVHFEGRGTVEELTKTIKTAVAAQSVRSGAHQHHQH